MFSETVRTEKPRQWLMMQSRHHSHCIEAAVSEEHFAELPATYIPEFSKQLALVHDYIHKEYHEPVDDLDIDDDSPTEYPWVTRAFKVYDKLVLVMFMPTHVWSTPNVHH